MNRVVIIGNGFDLAHSLPTRYEDFINWYWAQWGQRLRSYSGKVAEDMFCSFRLKENIGLAGWYLVWGYRYQILFKQYSDRELAEIAINDTDVCDFRINSVFFSRICESIETKGWVDIEREYYNLLREAVIKPENCRYTISELNRQLCLVQNLLAEYLSSVTTVDIKCDERIHHQIYGKIRENDICISQLSKYYDYVRYLIDHADTDYQRLLCRYGIEGPTRHYMTMDLQRLVQFHDATKIEDIYLKDLVLPENILFQNLIIQV